MHYKDQVPHEVKSLRAKATMTSQIIKWIDVNYPKWIVVLGAPDRVNITCLMHGTRLYRIAVKMTSTERNYKACCDAKTGLNNIYVGS